MGKPNRIREWRKAKGLTLEQLSEMTSISTSFLSRMESGKRRVSLDYAKAIASALGISTGDISTDEPQTVPLVGYVGAGAEAHYYGEAQGPFGEVEAPEGSTDKTVAVEIRGESLGSFFDRWLVFYDEVRLPPTADMIGKLCVVGLPDGRVLIKKLARSTLPKLWVLLSQFEPPIYDVPIEWAARVKTMVPR
jgi:transcriptional regulator with XRE-family HTH domain